MTSRSTQRALDDRVEQVQSAIARSSDLLLRILYSTELMLVDDQDIDKGVYTREVTPVAELVEQARGSTDPMVLDLMVQRCRGGSHDVGACDAVDYARRWTETDPQNQLAWLTLASVLQQRGDGVEARAAFIRAARAPSWHESYLEIARVVARASPSTSSVQVRNAELANARARANVAGVPNSAFTTLGAYCKQGGDLRVACARIVATIARDTDTLMGLAIVVPYAVHARIDSTVVSGYQEEADAVRWAMRFVAITADGRGGDAAADDETLRGDNAKLQAMIDLGERRIGEQVLLEQHVSRGEAAALYLATLSPDERQRRIDRLAAR